MNKLDKNKVYSLEELTSEELKEIYNVTFKTQHRYKYLYYWEGSPTFANEDELFNEVVNAKELFYTLENIQVDCRELSKEHIKEMANVFEANGFNVDKKQLSVDSKYCYLCFVEYDVWVYNGFKSKSIITYEKFMELFAEPRYEVKYIAEQPNKTFNPQPHYNNDKGSLYKVAQDRNWNAYLFDVVKRLERGGKKDPLEQEIQKSIDLLNLWLIEHGQSSN